MKNPYVIGGIIILIVILGLVWVGISKGPEQAGAPVVPIGTSTPIILTTIRSEVTALRGTDRVAASVEASTTLSDSDSVRTGAMGRALLEDEDFKTVIDHDSELSIADVALAQAKLDLNSGSVWLRVEKVFGKGEGVEVNTPNAVAAVRGTSFGVSYANGTTTLIVTTGTVAFSSHVNPDMEIPVSAGHKAIIGPDGKIKVFLLSPIDKITEWFRYNNPDANSNDKPKDTSSPNPVSPVTVTTSTTTTTSTVQATATPASSPALSASIHIDAVSPGKMPPEQQALLKIYGSGFKTAKRLFIGSTKFDFSIIDDGTISTTVFGLAAGTYDIKISNADSSDTLAKALTVAPR